MSSVFLNEKDFKNLKEPSKWNYVQSLYKKIEELQIQADKNCEEFFEQQYFCSNRTSETAG
jgi:hypothetical protein